MKKEISLLTLCVLVLFLSACSSGPQKYMLTKEESKKEEVKQQTGLANPATLFCMNTTGATWSIAENSEEQYGICTFSDASWCEEWAYYQNKCIPGTNITSCGKEFRTKSVCPPDYLPVCAKIYNNQTSITRWEKFSNSCKACTSADNINIVIGYLPGECQ